MEAANLYLLLKDYSKAAERYEWVIQNHPLHPMAKKAYLAEEEALRSLGRTEQVEKLLKEMVAKFPQDNLHFEGHLRLGLLYFSQKKWGEAVSSFSRAAQSPEDRISSQAQMKLGDAYWEGGNREAALLQFSKAVYLYPNRPEVTEEALLKLGRLYLEENRPSEARQIYQKLLEKTKREDRRETARKMLDQLDKGAVR